MVAVATANPYKRAPVVTGSNNLELLALPEGKLVAASLIIDPPVAGGICSGKLFLYTRAGTSHLLAEGEMAGPPISWIGELPVDLNDTLFATIVSPFVSQIEAVIMGRVVLP